MFEFTFGRILLGTLVLNSKTGRAEHVCSMQYSEIKRDRLGPEFIGEINGRPSSEYEDLPVTVPLLTALGWVIAEDKKSGFVSAWPPVDQCPIRDSIDEFEIRFLLADEAVKGYSRDDVVTTNSAGDWVDIGDFVLLEEAFIRKRSRRMDIIYDGEVGDLPLGLI